MKTKYLAISALAFSIGVIGMRATPAFGAPQGPPPPGYQQGPGGWDAPPGEFREFQRQGFHDGIEGARKDFDHHRRPDVDNRDEFRHPHVPRDMREDYRDGFRHGYEVAMHHLMGEHPY